MPAPEGHGQIEKIVSGGQTGVDRGALDAAISLDIPHGGWCPKGRIAEDGCIDPQYQLSELDVSDYAARTQRNVLDSDATLILYPHRMTGGTALTNRLAKESNKPLLRVRIDRTIDYDRIDRWLQDHQVRTLNVAGPRGSSAPGLQEQAYTIVRRILQGRPGLFSAQPDDDSRD